MAAPLPCQPSRYNTLQEVPICDSSFCKTCGVFYFVYMSVCLQVCVYTMCVQFPMQTEEGTRRPGTGVEDGYELPRGMLGTDPQVLWKSSQRCEPLGHLFSLSFQVLIHTRVLAFPTLVP